MSHMKAWIEAMRLRTLPVSVAGVVGAWAVAVRHGDYEWIPGVICLVFALLCQIASNFANEYYDYRAGRDRAGREGPRRGVTEGDLTPGAMLNAIYGVLGLAALVGLSLCLWGGWWLIGAGAFIGLGALAYSTGPYPLSTHGLGEAAVFFFFGVIPVNLTYYVMTGGWSLIALEVSAAIGLMGANVLIVNNYRDIPDDIVVGKRTLAVILGPRSMYSLYLVNAMLAAVAVIPFCRHFGDMALLIPLAYLVVSRFLAGQLRQRSGASLTPLLGMTSILMFLTACTLLILSLLTN